MLTAFELCLHHWSLSVFQAACLFPKQSPSIFSMNASLAFGRSSVWYLVFKLLIYQVMSILAGHPGMPLVTTCHLLVESGGTVNISVCHCPSGSSAAFPAPFSSFQFVPLSHVVPLTTCVLLKKSKYMLAQCRPRSGGPRSCFLSLSISI